MTAGEPADIIVGLLVCIFIISGENWPCVFFEGVWFLIV